ncbi:MAG: NAD(P)/FAD-dependent oxidoreductase [Neisseriaceae bacterium]|nr:NAD(P)/FAD-dependent oxidoreductase [Neisseriaceae bacterium]
MKDFSINRRQFLQFTAAGVAAAALPLGSIQAETSKQKARIVILGCGLAGLAAAHRLRRQLPNAQITLVDGKWEHNYQPGYTLVATGVWRDTSKVKANNDKLIPKGVRWIQEAAAEIQSDAQLVITHSGNKLPYDYLIVATGLRLGYEKIEGLDILSFGQNGLASVYHSPETAMASWHAMDAFRKKGGRAIMTLAPTDMKCAGAPLKMTFMLADRIRQAGTAKNSQIDFFAPKTSIFGVKPVADKVLDIWKTLEVAPQVHYHHELTAVDMDKKIAYFRQPETNEQFSEHYDFIHIVPPMYAPDVILNNSDLANEKGWLAVSAETLQHTKYPNIFGLGDVNGTPRGKTAATVKKSTPVVVHNLIRTINGQTPDAIFDGYTSCPMLVREGEAMLVEFNYKGELTPTVPLVNPLQPSYFAWYLEEVMLKPAYMTVLRGRA